MTITNPLDGKQWEQQTPFMDGVALFQAGDVETYISRSLIDGPQDILFEMLVDILIDIDPDGQ